jgi:hypothetical protein
MTTRPNGEHAFLEDVADGIERSAEDDGEGLTPEQREQRREAAERLRMLVRDHGDTIDNLVTTAGIATRWTRRLSVALFVLLAAGFVIVLLLTNNGAATP